eukprot:CAMPEP_0113547082 /NCGR_PEP_ID=MMETSP0015_2-20120614/12156_1 /TAXON_ID=2838 /ORGANISM="Odontella" /LENGTH=507 /DNA_ID=CAMNT_0000447593 /DNA_START=40 /DNA_END=1566 /DNA_ORIENTATION=+ /assembly_acc=CAM_ASM_000160
MILPSYLLLILATPAVGYNPSFNAGVLSKKSGGTSRSSALAPPTSSFPTPLSPIARSHRPDPREESDDGPSGTPSRRDVLTSVAAAALIGTSTLAPRSSASAAPGESVGVAAAVAAGYRYSPDWTGTSLSLLPPREAAALARRGRSVAADNGDDRGLFAFPMGRWPDPILRRPASPAPPSLFGTPDLRDVALALRSAARAEGAVGLAAQQCAVDVRLVWLDDSHAAAGDARRNGAVRWLAERWRNRAKGNDDDDEISSTSTLGEGVRGHHYYHDDGEGLFLVNPRIVARSPEVDMRVWTERCLVLPPSFSASVLRDATIAVEYETLDGVTERAELGGELARACQHEMDHDRGILITDHVGMDELESDDMRRVEKGGHGERMVVAYARTVEESRSSSSSSTGADEGGSRALSSRQYQRGSEGAFWESFLVPPARAEDVVQVPDASSAPTCDGECLEKRKRMIEERRAMMRQSRSSTSRQDVFDLSRQRAALYNATYQGASCPPGVPCL